ncbi:MAG: hypothetical protein Q9223_002663 [Gallowayella weberi]
MSQQPLLRHAFVLTARNALQPLVRNTVQRRLASGEMPKLTGAADNAFNRERMAVKQHAQASSGTLNPRCPTQEGRRLISSKIFGGNFPSSKEPPYHSMSRKRLTRLSVAIPSLIIAAINAKNLWDEHWEHWSHLPPLEDRVEYDYMNIRTKKFFWGDGDKTLL